MLQRLEIEPPIDESQSRPAPCVFGSVRGAGAARGGGGSFCSRRPEAEVVASGATAGGLPATRAPRVTATTQHYRAPLRTRQLTGVEPSGTFHFHFSSGTEITCSASGVSSLWPWPTRRDLATWTGWHRAPAMVALLLGLLLPLCGLSSVGAAPIHIVLSVIDE